MYANKDLSAELPQRGCVTIAGNGSKRPLLVEVSDSLKCTVGERWEYLSQIEERLHSILNLRVPENKDESEDREIGSFADEMESIIDVERNQNYRLGKILDHIKALV